jgi:cell division protein FtsB
METNLRLLRRLNELEMNAKETEELDAYCVQLEAEIEALNSGRATKKRGREQLSLSEMMGEGFNMLFKRTRSESTK